MHAERVEEVRLEHPQFAERIDPHVLALHNDSFERLEQRVCVSQQRDLGQLGIHSVGETQKKKGERERAWAFGNIFFLSFFAKTIVLDICLSLQKKKKTLSKDKQQQTNEEH